MPDIRQLAPEAEHTLSLLKDPGFSGGAGSAKGWRVLVEKEVALGW